MDKKYLVVLAVAVVGGIGFFVYKGKINEKDVKTHNTQELNRIMEVADKSTIAGLGQMGLALNKYKQEKGAYPDNLSALYPDYIPVKAFIVDIQWQYEPKGNDFYLAKTIRTKDNKVLTAAIGSDLMPVEKSMVASLDAPRRLPVKSAAKPAIQKPETRITLASKTNPQLITEVIAPEISAINQRKFDSRSDDIQNPLKSRPSALFELEPVPTQKLSKEEQFVQRIRGDFLVWKNKDGSLGFGNVQYPTSDKMTIYDNEEWVQIRQQSVDAQIKSAAWRPQEEKADVTDRLIAARSDNFLVWKDSRGIICFGNVQYPLNQNIQIHVDGRWQPVKTDRQGGYE